MTGNLIVRSSLSILLAALGVSAVGEDLSIELFLAATSHGADVDAIRAQVKENFDRIESLHVVTRIWNPNYSRDRSEVHVSQPEWAFTGDGRIMVFEAQAVPVEEEPGEWPARAVRVFDGEEGRAAAFDEEGKQTAGNILDEEMIRSDLELAPSHQTEFGRMMGWVINEKSLVEWLADPDARIEGRETLGDTQCAVVSVPFRDWRGTKRFYLAENKSYALKRHEFVLDGDIAYLIDVDQLAEVEPGLWLPMSAMLDSRGRQLPDRPPLRARRVEVVDLEVNTPLPSELFELEFEHGLHVMDYAAGLVKTWGTDDVREMFMSHEHNAAAAAEDRMAALHRRSSRTRFMGYVLIGVSLACIAGGIAMCVRGAAKKPKSQIMK